MSRLKIQEDILNDRSKKCLVSASAGSGKTTIMIDKIFSLLDSGIPCENLAVLTFTDLAGTEMRERLVAKVKERLSQTQDSKYLDILDKLKTASIDTIDGFCKKNISKYFYCLGLNPNIDIISDINKQQYINTAFYRTIEEFDEKDMTVLSGVFIKNARNYEELKSATIACYDFMNIQPDTDEWLRHVRDIYVQNDHNASQQYIDCCVKSACAKYLDSIRYVSTFTSNKKVSDNATKCKQICELLTTVDVQDNFESLYYIAETSFVGARVADAEKDDYDVIKRAVDTLKSEISKVLQLGLFSKNQEKARKITIFLDIFTKFVQIFAKNYELLKSSHDVVDFLDIEKLMLRLLDNPIVSAELKNIYQYVFVDEYQDINPLQDAIITRLSSDSDTFMVGDLKQSIYGFRLSCPELFLDKCDMCRYDAEANLYNMNTNFRSNPKILHFVNDVFSRLMTMDTSDIDYVGENMFEPQRNDYPVSGDEVSILLCDKLPKTEYTTAMPYSVMNAEKENIDIYSLENLAVAEQISSLVGTEYYDAKTRTTKILTYDDITILTRSVECSETKNLIQTLDMYGIPTNCKQKFSFDDCESVGILVDILKVLTNIADDKCYLTYFKSSIGGGLTMNDFAHVRQHFADAGYDQTFFDLLRAYDCADDITAKLNYGFDNIQKMQNLIAVYGVSQFIDYLLYRQGLYLDIINSPQGVQDYETLRTVLATIYSSSSDLDLVQTIKALESNMGLKSFSRVASSMNSVNIQTIHGSKGLEYPVVILFNTGKGFNYTDKGLFFDKDYGIGMCAYDDDVRVMSETYQYCFMRDKKRQSEYKEELRLLYVAFTRAKNKLIITATVPFKDGGYSPRNADNYIDNILSCFGKNINIDSDIIALDNANIHVVREIGDLEKIEKNTKKYDKNIEKIKKNIDFSYKYDDLTKISIKNNVTAITQSINEEHNILPRFLYVNENKNLSSDEISALGTRYHKALEEMDFSRDFDHSMLTKYADIDTTFLPNIFDQIRKILTDSVSHHKETQFMMYVPYRDIYTESDISDKILVQGVVDLLVEYDDRFVIVDYKYSSLNGDKLKAKYATQLKLYKIAVERAYKKPVSSCYILSLKTGELICVD